MLRSTHPPTLEARVAPIVAAMFFALASLLGATASWAYVPPAMTGHVTDAAGKLSPAERDALGRKLAAYRTCSTNEVAVFVAASLDGETIEDVAYTTFNGWKLGKSGRDNGVLLVVAPTERKVRIEVGKGLDGALPDLRANDILREHVSPHLKNNEVWRALDEGTTEIGRALGGCAMSPAVVGGDRVPAATPRPAPYVTPRSPPRPDPSPIPYLLMALTLGVLGGGAVRGRRSGWAGVLITSVVVAIVFAVWSQFLGGFGRDFDAVTGWFAIAVFVLVLANIISWGARRYEGPETPAGEWVTPPGGSSSAYSAPSSPSWTSSSSSSSDSLGSGFDSSSSGGASDFSGGGGSSGGAGSSDSY